MCHTDQYDPKRSEDVMKIGIIRRLVISVLFVIFLVVLGVYNLPRSMYNALPVNPAPLNMADPTIKAEKTALNSACSLEKRQRIYHGIYTSLISLRVSTASKECWGWPTLFRERYIAKLTPGWEMEIAKFYHITPRQLTMVWDEGQENGWYQNGSRRDDLFVRLPEQK